MAMLSENLFRKIIDGEIPADIVHEDEHCLAFRDISPQAPTHVLLIPREEIRTLDDVSASHQELLGHMMVVVGQLARQLGIAEDGYRLVVNCKDQGGQTVPHLHMHLLGGRDLTWPPG